MMGDESDSLSDQGAELEVTEWERQDRSNKNGRYKKTSKDAPDVMESTKQYTVIFLAENGPYIKRMSKKRILAMKRDHKKFCIVDGIVIKDFPAVVPPYLLKD